MAFDASWRLLPSASRKPDEFYDLVLSHTQVAMRRADLFSRQTRPGFEGWGNEHGKFDEPAVAAE
jgi:N6-adenosine-specific RNA methylase IME4